MREAYVSAFAVTTILVFRFAEAGVGDVFACVFPPHAIAESSHGVDKLCTASASRHGVLDGGAQAKFPTLAFLAGAIFSRADGLRIATLERREHGKSVGGADLVIELS